MAAKRIAQSNINWAALAERVPVDQKVSFTAFKSRSDKYLRAVLANPAESPKLDWAYYKARVATPGLVDTFQKSLEALKVPYPADTLTAQVDALRKEYQADIAKMKQESAERIANHEKELERIKSLLPYSQMTLEDFRDAHPDLALDPLNKPTFWPHEPEDQLEWIEAEEAKAKALEAEAKGGH